MPHFPERRHSMGCVHLGTVSPLVSATPALHKLVQRIKLATLPRELRLLLEPKKTEEGLRLLTCWTAQREAAPRRTALVHPSTSKEDRACCCGLGETLQGLNQLCICQGLQSISKG